ncbi:hypothetical protein PseudUWO311_02285 [Pseudanabaena sp. UWO311]|uniref:hypothetical protein n=1 Tax=Pseudanabaena sp. UWO311 TaxID=2487337 RepID=UPI00115AFCE0|nr:hypothetical protein [Pseudanabaena sp. UWO311]TYQ28988.1 hypothetical protein PseudUWO311_02285 [Pseudanabaena sp. UWO311]
MSLILGLIKTQELIGGAERRQSILGFYVLVHLTTAIDVQCLKPKSINLTFAIAQIYRRLTLKKKLSRCSSTAIFSVLEQVWDR